MDVTQYFFRLYGLSIASPFALPGAAAVAPLTGVADVTIRWQPDTAWQDTGCRIIAVAASPEAPDLGETAEGGLCLIWGSELRFVISATNDRITVVCRQAKLEFAPIVLVGVVLGLLLHRRGILCLHGAVVAWSERTIVLLGQSGAGKSTTAAALVSQGAELLSDDVAALRRGNRGVYVEPGCASIRLEPSAKTRLLSEDMELPSLPYVDKLLWTISDSTGSAESRFAEPRRLDAIYVLDSTTAHEGVEAGPALPPPHALRCLVEGWYPPGFQGLLTKERLDDLSAVAKNVPVLLVRYPKRWDILPDLLAALSP